MNAFIEVVLFLGLVFGRKFIGAPLLVWTGIIGVTLLLLRIGGDMSLWFMLLCGAIYLSSARLFNIPKFRLNILTKLILKLFQKLLPPMSRTEKEAIESGDVWWDGKLFSGKPDWQKLMIVPKPY